MSFFFFFKLIILLLQAESPQFAPPLSGAKPSYANNFALCTQWHRGRGGTGGSPHPHETGRIKWMSIRKVPGTRIGKTTKENKGWEFSWAVKSSFLTQCLLLSPVSVSNSDTNFSGGSMWQFKCLGTCHSCGRSRLSPRLLTWTSPCPWCCAHLGRKSANRRSEIFLAFQIKTK